jgi:hypothetical protein
MHVNFLIAFLLVPCAFSTPYTYSFNDKFWIKNNPDEYPCKVFCPNAYVCWRARIENEGRLCLPEGFDANDFSHWTTTACGCAPCPKPVAPKIIETFVEKQCPTSSNCTNYQEVLPVYCKCPEVIPCECPEAASYDYGTDCDLKQTGCFLLKIPAKKYC